MQQTNRFDAQDITVPIINSASTATDGMITFPEAQAEVIGDYGNAPEINLDWLRSGHVRDHLRRQDCNQVELDDQGENHHPPPPEETVNRTGGSPSDARLTGRCPRNGA